MAGQAAVVLRDDDLVRCGAQRGQQRRPVRAEDGPVQSQHRAAVGRAGGAHRQPGDRGVRPVSPHVLDDAVGDVEVQLLVQRPAQRGGVQVHHPVRCAGQRALHQRAPQAAPTVPGSHQEHADHRQVRLEAGHDHRPGQAAVRVIDAEALADLQQQPPRVLTGRPAAITGELHAGGKVTLVEGAHAAGNPAVRYCRHSPERRARLPRSPCRAWLAAGCVTWVRAAG